MRESTFKDRHDAGRFLAMKLEEHTHQQNAIVLALPRGGVPVGYEIARMLHLPLDVFLVRKLSAPWAEELAIGAIATGGGRVLNENLVRKLGVTAEMLEAITAEQERELRRREQLYRLGRPPAEVSGKAVILVDDGLATGASMRAAVQALRLRNPERIIVAVPVGAAETCQDLEDEVEEVVCGHAPEDFRAVGMWYDDFSQTSDQEVAELLEQAARQHATELASTLVPKD